MRQMRISCLLLCLLASVSFNSFAQQDSKQQTLPSPSPSPTVSPSPSVTPTPKPEPMSSSTGRNIMSSSRRAAFGKRLMRERLGLRFLKMKARFRLAQSHSIRKIRRRFGSARVSITVSAASVTATAFIVRTTAASRGKIWV
jgi:hypothetical protein